MVTDCFIPVLCILFTFIYQLQLMGSGQVGLRGRPVVQPAEMVLGQEEEPVLILHRLMVEITVRGMTLTLVYVIYDIAQVMSRAAS